MTYGAAVDAQRLSALTAAGGIEALLDGATLDVTGSDPVLATPFAAGEVAALALAAVGACAARLAGVETTVRVDVVDAAASLLSFLHQQVVTADGVDLFRDVNPGFTALHECRDGRWIHLHGGFPHLRDGAARVLGVPADASTESIAAACAAHDAFALEDELADAGLCGAVARSPEEWCAHPHGIAMSGLPAVRVRPHEGRSTAPTRGAAALAGDPARPLRGLRVLDCTRVLAGPTCGRTLAALGADVLRIGAPQLPTITAFEIDTGTGKRSTSLDLDDAEDRSRFDALLDEADVLVWGFRRGSRERHGFDPDAVAHDRPGLVTVGLNAYGPDGPWADRRGWEQLAQSAAGIAVVQGTPDAPALIPAAATDYTTGYLAAAGVLAALTDHPATGAHVEVSLVQTAQWLLAVGTDLDPAAASGIPAAAITARLEEDASPFGRVRRLPFPLAVDGMALGWNRPAEPVGHSDPIWLAR